MIDKTVLAIDPGSSKCGVALVRRDVQGNISLLWRAISARDKITTAVAEAQTKAPFSMMIVGSGTKSKEIVSEIRDAFPSAGILVVDEKDTSLQARERYWEHVPRTGWRRLLPASLQVPPEPIDDFVAMILAERVLVV